MLGTSLFAVGARTAWQDDGAEFPIGRLIRKMMNVLKFTSTMVMYVVIANLLHERSW